MTTVLAVHTPADENALCTHTHTHTHTHIHTHIAHIYHDLTELLSVFVGKPLWTGQYVCACVGVCVCVCRTWCVGSCLTQ